MMAKLFPVPNEYTLLGFTSDVRAIIDGMDFMSDECLRMASDPTTDPMVLFAIAVASYVRRNRGQPPTGVETQPGPPPAMLAVARNPNCGASMLERMAQWRFYDDHYTWHVLKAVVENPQAALHAIANPGGDVARILRKMQGRTEHAKAP